MVRTHFLWGVVLVLFLAFAAQSVMWRNLREEETTASAQNFTSIAQKHRQLSTHIQRAKEKRQRLENAVIWNQPHQILPLLGKVATELSVKLVGVEELPSKRVTDYQSFPLRLTFSGDYEGFSAFLAIVEKISPPVKIEELRIYQQERYPGTLWMSLIVAPMQRSDSDGPQTAIEVPPQPQMAFGRDAFAFGVDTVTMAPQAPDDGKSVVPAVTPLPTLTGILWSERDPIAIFTDHQQRTLLARVDEIIADARVINIQPQYVVLRRGGERVELKLWKADQAVSVR